jgi:hypothetical protein
VDEVGFASIQHSYMVISILEDILSVSIILNYFHFKCYLTIQILLQFNTERSIAYLVQEVVHMSMRQREG